ncbi:hypothetical protein KA529_03995 [Candidatus Saccharibacteria bacterium]|nr:hypothetical protein [Candidatus Saccharibacteria bacterium]
MAQKKYFQPKLPIQASPDSTAERTDSDVASKAERRSFVLPPPPEISVKERHRHITDEVVNRELEDAAANELATQLSSMLDPDNPQPFNGYSRFKDRMTSMDKRVQGVTEIGFGIDISVGTTRVDNASLLLVDSLDANGLPSRAVGIYVELNPASMGHGIMTFGFEQDSDGAFQVGVEVLGVNFMPGETIRRKAEAILGAVEEIFKPEATVIDGLAGPIE